MRELSVEAEVGSGESGQLPEALAYTDETCRAVAEEMAMTGVMKMRVLDRIRPGVWQYRRAGVIDWAEARCCAGVRA